MPLFTLGVLMVTDDSLDGLFTLYGLLLRAEELHPNALAQGIEVLIQEKFLHLLIDRRKFLNQHAPHDFFILFRPDVFLLPVENLREGMLEPPIQSLRLSSNGLHSRTDHRRMLLPVVPPQQRHLLDSPEEQMQHIGRIEQHLKGLPLPHGQTASLQILLPRSTALLQEVVVESQEFTIQPVIFRQPRLQVFLQEREPVLAIDEEEIGYGKRPYDLQRILRGRCQEFLQLLSGRRTAQLPHQFVRTAPAVNVVGKIQEAVHLVIEEEHQRLHSTLQIRYHRGSNGKGKGGSTRKNVQVWRNLPQKLKRGDRSRLQNEIRCYPPGYPSIFDEFAELNRTKEMRLSAGRRDEEHTLHSFHQSLQKGNSTLYGYCLPFLHSPLHEQIGLFGSIMQPGHYTLQLRILPPLPLEAQLDVVISLQQDMVWIFFPRTRSPFGGRLLTK